MSAVRTSRDLAAARMVERQMRNWELARAQRVAEPNRPEVEDFIAISRCAGAGGKEIASMLGEKLGWPVFDKEILEVMAGDDALRRRIYDSMDERDLTWFEDALRIIMQPGFVKNDYFHRLTQTVLSIARQSHAVFLGRGAHLILPRGLGFRVRIVAPHEACVQTVAGRAAVTIKQAEATVRKLEQERADFIRNHFGVDAADPTQHDLLINLERFNWEQAVELIISAWNIAGRDRQDCRPG